MAQTTGGPAVRDRSALMEQHEKSCHADRAEPRLEALDTQALFANLYAELHRMARQRLAGSSNSGLGATTLLHEVYLKLSNDSTKVFSDYGSFLAYAGCAMRSIVVDRARVVNAVKRGANIDFTTWGDQPIAEQSAPTELEQIGAALEELTIAEPDLAKIVDLKFFCGLSFDEIAALEATSVRTIQRKWKRARVYLHHVIRNR